MDIKAPGSTDRISTAPAVRRLPGVEGFWVFIAGDLSIFTILFGAFLVHRSADPAGYEAARHVLNWTHGGINTLLLLTSSWAVAKSLICARTGDAIGARRALAFGIGFGVAFVGSKAFEYAAEIGAGHTPGDNQFLADYFMITGIHLFHVVVGCLLLTAFHLRWRRGVEPARLTGFESVACFWHLVDFLWVLIFPLLYLAR